MEPKAFSFRFSLLILFLGASSSFSAPPPFETKALRKLEKIYEEKEEAERKDQFMALTPAQKREKEKIMGSGVEIVVFRKGGIMEKIPNGERYTTNESIFIRIFAYPDKENKFHLAPSGPTPQGPPPDPTFRVHVNYLVRLQDITDLRNRPLEHKEITQTDKIYNVRTSLLFSTALNVHLRTDQYSFSNNYLGTPTLSGNSYLIENRTYFRGLLPLEFGLALGYQQGTASDNGREKFEYKAFSAGPVLRSPFLQWGKTFLKAHVGVVKTLSSRITVLEESKDLEISRTSLLVGADILFNPSPRGMVIGFVYSWDWTRFKNLGGQGDSGNSQPSPVDHSIGVYIGHRWGKIL